ncbi:uncharacterized protein LOC131947795 [Physella acuta]|uniref:uncharacterized protein LOC131947795 n=1 Tax=Physella acuta TaxID=109671 RepID=UPI0027DC5D26|nr:uncharacterized protein LOC131947795 [Physella acuta]
MPENFCLIHMAELPGCLMKDDSVYLNQIIHRYLCTCHIDLIQRAKILATSAVHIFLRFFPPLFFFRWFVTCALLASEITLAALIDVTSICRTNLKKPKSKSPNASGTHKMADHHGSLTRLISLILIQVLAQWAIPLGQLAALVLLRLCHTSHQLAGVDMFTDPSHKQQKILLYRRLLGKVTCDGDGGADGKEDIKQKKEWLVDHAIDGAIRAGVTCPPMKLVFQVLGVREGMNLAREITARYWNKHLIKEPDDVTCDVSGYVHAVCLFIC